MFHPMLGGASPTRLLQNRRAIVGYVLKRRCRRIHRRDVFHPNLTSNLWSLSTGHLICIRMRIAPALLIHPGFIGVISFSVDPRTITIAKAVCCHCDHQASERSDRGISQQGSERREEQSYALLQDQDYEMTDLSSLISNIAAEN